ncbi:MAG: hypothetical protein K6C12_15225 [Oscillospiraceae bacterium]|nr:hypothetical protein [Oscillospiraceae bacterium]
MIIATTTEYGTDEDSEIASRVTRSVFDNFMRRPSLEDRAIRTIAIIANNDLAIMNAKEEEPVSCDAAFVFVDRGKARFLISGSSVCCHFEDGKLVHRSLREEAEAIGSGMRFEPRLEPAFEIQTGKNAFLAGSRSLAENLTDQDLEETLQESETPEEWMRRLRQRMGEEKQFCAITAFLPPEKPLLKLFSRREKSIGGTRE